MRDLGKDGGMEGKKENGRGGGVGGWVGKTETGLSHNSHVLFHCQLENKENIELVDILA